MSQPVAGMTRQAQRNPQGTATTTVTTPGTSRDSSEPSPSGTLRLRGEPAAQTDATPQRRVQWAEDVVNNEGMGKKSSKVCCIYHKPRDINESSDESSSSSDDSDSDSGDDDGAARPSTRRGHSHQNGDPCSGHGESKHKEKRVRKAVPNAYEKQSKASRTGPH